MQPRIEQLPEKKYIGLSISTSLKADQTFQLFRTFMPRRKEITNAISKDVLDLKTFPSDYFSQFNPTKEFTKWALVEVADDNSIPTGMGVFTLPAGEYAVFTDTGGAGQNSIFTYIFAEWLPQSEYAVDERPHFDVLDEKFQRRDPDAKQEIWIPIKRKTVVVG